MIQRERSRWFPSEFRGEVKGNIAASEQLRLASEDGRLNFEAKLGVGVFLVRREPHLSQLYRTLTRHKGLSLILLPVEYTGVAETAIPGIGKVAELRCSVGLGALGGTNRMMELAAGCNSTIRTTVAPRKLIAVQ